jgi:anaerobic magnesium-protoporphyrin IX monomethyl ester cyclase
MKKSIDCLIIGYNEPGLPQLEASLREMGTDSGAYRNFHLSFIRSRGQLYHITDLFNTTFASSRTSPGQPAVTPLRDGDIFSAAIAYLGTYLHRAGLNFDFINSFTNQKDLLQAKLEQDELLTVAITTTYYVMMRPVLEIIDFIRQYNREVKILVGGPFIANQARVQDEMAFAYILETLGADVYVNSSQGEAALVEVINAFKHRASLERIPNIYWRENAGDDYRSNAMIREDNRIADNPVNWSLFANRLGQYADLRTSISCPFSCAFCGFPERAGAFQTAPAANIERELNQLQAIDSVVGVSFIDDTLNVPPQRFKEILKLMLKHRCRFKWICYLRCQYVDREMVALMKQAGCEGVFLGIESGSNKILKNMNKSAAVEKFLAGITLLKEYGIMTFGSFIIGFPGETDETVRETVDFIKTSGVDFYRAHLWFCDPITPVWRDREKYRLRGESFEWSHATMDYRAASDWVEKIFVSVGEALWIPQYYLEFDNLWHMFHKGLAVEQIHGFIRWFNDGVRERLVNPSKPEVGPAFFEGLRRLAGNPGDPGEAMLLPGDIAPFDDFGVDFDF